MRTGKPPKSGSSPCAEPKRTEIMALHETVCRGLQTVDPNSRTGVGGPNPCAHDLEDPIFGKEGSGLLLPLEAELQPLGRKQPGVAPPGRKDQSFLSS